MYVFTERVGRVLGTSFSKTCLTIYSLRSDPWQITAWVSVFSWLMIFIGLLYAASRILILDRSEDVYEEDREGLLRVGEGELDVPGQMYLEQRDEWSEDVFIQQDVGTTRI